MHLLHSYAQNSLHKYIPVDSVQLVVESARVADGLAVVVAPPQRRVARAAVGAALAVSPRRRLHTHNTTWSQHDPRQSVSK